MDTFDHLWEQAEMNRRELLAAGAATGFVAGFAMSVQPVQAQTMIVTDTAGIDAAMGEFPTPTGPIPAYRALPAGGKSRPLILVVQEIFGLHEHIKDVCRRLAKLGYCAVAPSLYHRQGDVTKLATFDEIRPIVAKVPDAQVMSDLDAPAPGLSTPAGPTPARSASQASAGAGASYGSTRHTAPRSRPASPGMAVLWRQDRKYSRQSD